DDYPDFARQVAERVAGDPEHSRGVLLCGSGTGMDAAANKVKGIRAALASSAQIARAARNDDDVNVISLPADFLSVEEAKEIAEVFLKTPFEAAERRVRRLQKIAEIEKKNFK
ncbi:MAG: RpiB/LacA/LacB family sugar-phosphate isomerase, partial [bacterium]|nr:RpiB/LacA/LacB family sugar-phosphate isomerase [bacterium]